MKWQAMVGDSSQLLEMAVTHLKWLEFSVIDWNMQELAGHGLDG